jgi:hypothetical protein
MTLSSLVVSRDWSEVSVLECILGSLHIGVQVEPEPEQARVKLDRSKIDALIVDCDVDGSQAFLRNLQAETNTVPLVIISRPGYREMEWSRTPFIFEKPISVDQAVHTLSAARNLILDGRLRYHRQTIRLPLSVTNGSKKPLRGHVRNLSQTGAGIRMLRPQPLEGKISLDFALPPKKRGFKLDGEIVWTDNDGNAGVRFLNIAEPVRRDLRLWLAQKYLTH